ncbi:MAG: Polyamine-transporting ATPase [Pelosinus sp.]|jgi:osmoprotectant transport system ATP-binding protein|nr:Polyamine-transporting ATPase [Pelosinus sp.]
MARTAIEFRNVSKQYTNASQYAVSGVNISIEEGSFITILGTSGSGKTTFLKMVNRIYEPTSGEILYFGQPIQNLQLEEYRRKIGYVIQQVGLFPHMTVEENIGTIPQILKWDKEKIANRVAELLELVCLSPKDFKKRYPRQLSGGQQQRVGLARAMAADPSIMLMDEPFGAIDAITRQNLQDELINIQRKLNKTILFVTHDVGEALKLGDKVVIMHEGKIQQFGAVYEIISKPANDYVARLIATQDIVQRLKVLKAQSVMLPVDPLTRDNAFRVSKEESLHKILTYFLEHDHNHVLVEDERRSVVGKITWDQLKASTKQGKILSA